MFVGITFDPSTLHRFAGEGALIQSNGQNVLYLQRDPGDDATDARQWLLQHLQVQIHR